MKHTVILTGVVAAVLTTVYNIGCAGIRVVDFWLRQRGEIWSVELELADSEDPEEISALCQDWVNDYSLQSAGVIFNYSLTATIKED